MNDSFFTEDIVIVFLVVFFIVFSCGVIRGINKYYRAKTAHGSHAHQVTGHRNIIITTIEVPNEGRRRRNNETPSSPIFSSQHLQSMPPPYTIENDLPPSYDEATRREFTIQPSSISVDK